MAEKLEVSAAFLSAMEVGRKTIPIEYIDLEVDEIVKKFHVSEYCVLTRKLKVKKRSRQIK